MHPRPCWISELAQVVGDKVVEVVLVAGRQPEDNEAAAAWWWEAAVPSRLNARVGKVRDVVPSPDDMEEDAIRSAVLVCVAVADN